MKRNIIFVIALIIAGATILFYTFAENRVPEENQGTRPQSIPQLKNALPQEADGPKAVIVVKPETAAAGLVDPPVEKWTSEEVITEYRRLTSLIQNATRENIQRREVLLDREDTGIFKYEPIDAAVVAEVEAGMKRITDYAEKDNEVYTGHVLTGLNGALMTAKKHTVVQVMLHPDGTVDVTRWEMPEIPPLSINAAGRYEIAPEDYTKLGVIVGAGGWGQTPDKMYGAILPPKIKKTLADIKNEILGK